MSYDFALYLNNLAITCLQEGKDECAVQSIDAALHELSLYDPLFLSQDEIQGMRQLSEQPNCSQVLRSNFLQWTKIREVSSDDHCMYGFALILSEDLKESTYGTAIYYFVTKSVLHYNLGFIYQWRAVHRGKSSALEAALSHYMQAGEAITEIVGLRGTELEHLVLAVLNNIGHIHIQLLQFSKAQNYFYFLRLRIRHEVASLSLLQKMVGYETFVMNAMMQDSVPKFAAPAY